MRKSIDYITGILAILKSGATYLPLDTRWPPERISNILADAKPKLVISDRDDNSELHIQKSIVVLSWRSISTRLPRQKPISPEITPPTKTWAKQPAYLIYTSGSTGKPKGVLVSHTNLVSMLHGWNDVYQLSQRVDNHLQMASTGFDVFTGDWVRALCSGGKLVLVQTKTLMQPELLYKLMQTEQVDFAEFVPSVLRLLVKYTTDSRLSLDYMKVIVSGSDNWYSDEVEQLRVLCGQQTKIINGYGVTEATIDSLYFDTNQNQLSDSERQTPIGKPFPNVSAYLLDSNLNPLPIGAVGELYIGGLSVSLGYLNQDMQTSSRFLPDPFLTSASVSFNMYQTGDLARYLPNEQIELVGRSDQQVKIRGNRVELNEIEIALKSIPFVQDAIVVTLQNQKHQQLTGFIIPSQESLVTTHQNPQNQLVDDWEVVFENLYKGTNEASHSFDFNIHGWVSSYTRQPMATLDVKSWLDQTVDRVLSRKPRKVLELGCGSGLTLYRVAPHTATYTATDLSATVIEMLRSQIECQENSLSVELFHQPANDFNNFQDNSFDSVLLVSVVQYFPNSDYLEFVLTEALRVVEPGGFIFLSDIRSYQHIELFYKAVLAFQGADMNDVPAIKQQVKQMKKNETQLLVDPEFFDQMLKKQTDIAGIEYYLQAGEHHNELNQFRYDVAIRVGGEPQIQIENSLSWNKISNLTSLGQQLNQQPTFPLLIQDIPNARVLPENKGIHPDQLYELAKVRGLKAQISWSIHSELTNIDAVFWNPIVDGIPQLRYIKNFNENNEASPVISQPLKSDAKIEISTEIKRELAQKLPFYMVPEKLVLIDEFPLLPNQKIDRKQLTQTASQINLKERSIQTPSSQIQLDIQLIWSHLLKIKPELISVTDSYFELGGDSILVIHLVLELQKKGYSCKPKDVFEYPTILKLDKLLSKRHPEPSIQIKNHEIDLENLGPLKNTNTVIEKALPLSPFCGSTAPVGVNLAMQSQPAMRRAFVPRVPMLFSMQSSPVGS